ncbi:MAG: hypothetical protein DHS20C13_19890 [Thermodesulfobacteriota bacterium]|nr:MAG: hypothetical protein DHS20C13_19890 [Thermodesulfobacteriota bacterium]
MYKQLFRNAVLEVGLIVLFLIIGTLIILISSNSAKAEVTRGCKGYFSIDVLTSSKNLTTSNFSKVIDEFEGRGACKNKYHGNTCRERAKDNIFRCANDIWDNRWYLIGDPDDGRTDMILPAICRGDKTGARKVGFRTNPFGKGTVSTPWNIMHVARCSQAQTTLI